MKTVLRIIINFVLIVFLLFVFTCKKDELIKVTKLETGAVINITATTATFNATFIDLADNVTEYGHCWNTEGNPTIESTKKSVDGTPKKGDYTNDIEDLNPSTEYFVKAYAISGSKVTYGEQVDFKTKDKKVILISSPEESDDWKQGSIQTIVWTDNFSENVKIELYKGGSFESNIVTSTESDGNYLWTIPEGQKVGNNYSIKITSIDEASVTAESDEFGISEGPYISVTAPTIGSTWQKGETYTISWTDNITENVKIELLKDETKVNDIVSSTESDGSYNWSVSSSLVADNDYKIKITSTQDVNLHDESTNFTIAGNTPTLTTLSASDITGIAATLHGKVNPNGEEVVVVFEWGETLSYGNTVDATPSNLDGSVEADVNANISGLANGTTYHYRLVATHDDETSYGSDVSFTTLSLATVSTDAITQITSSTAVSGGYVSADGGSTVTERGVCWSVSESPTTSDFSISSGSGLGTFESNLTGLEENTTYYVRSFAVNSVGTAYGNQQAFTTQAPFIEITSPVTSSSWQVGTTHSIEWNDNINDNIKIELYVGSAHVLDIETSVSNTGSYSWTIPILTAGGIYKIKMSSVVDAGIFDESEEFTIICPSGSTGTLTDYDGNFYDAIKIGNQWWMAENLKVTHYSNGDEIPFITGNSDWADLEDDNTDKAYCFYNDNAGGEAETYGTLYSWAGAMNGASSTDNNPSGVQGVCPTGWHLPSDDEWKELEMELGMSESDANNINWRGTDQGKRLKEAGIIHWDCTGNEVGTNTSGFTGLPAGWRNYDDGTSANLIISTRWWSTTQYDNTSSWFRHLNCTRATVGRWYTNKSFGASVRCVKD